jgi:divalent metal cation (Fe/Co/Zn/Cd) transporter
LVSAVEIGMLLNPLVEIGGLDASASGTSLQSPLEPRSMEMNAIALSVVLGSVVAKETLFRKTLKAGQTANSSVCYVGRVCLLLL